MLGFKYLPMIKLGWGFLKDVITFVDDRILLHKKMYMEGKSRDEIKKSKLTTGAELKKKVMDRFKVTAEEADVFVEDVYGKRRVPVEKKFDNEPTRFMGL